MVTVVVGTPEFNIAGWSSLVARRAHNPKVVGSNPAPATNYQKRVSRKLKLSFLVEKWAIVPKLFPRNFSIDVI